jgi:hypothetical protein
VFPWRSKSAAKTIIHRAPAAQWPISGGTISKPGPRSSGMPLAKTIAAHRAATPEAPAIYRVGDQADAKPAAWLEIERW